MAGGGFSDSFVDDVRTRVSLVALIGKDIKLIGKGGEFSGLCPFHPEKTPSFTVCETKGFYHCFGCGAHGDCFDYVKARYGITFPAAVEELAIQVGLVPDRDGAVRPKAKPIARPSGEQLAADSAEKMEKARRIWRESGPITGSLAEKYLQARGIDLALVPGWPIPTLRFHPSLPCWCLVKGQGYEFFGNYPAMVAYVQDPAGGFAGVHRTFLDPSGTGKAVVPKPKQMLGSVYGGYCRLCRAVQDMGVAEGLETSLSVSMTGQPMWAALSEGNLGAPLPPIVRGVLICGDNDTKCEKTSKKRMDSAVRAHAARGCVVRVALPPRGMDFNDLLNGGSDVATRAY
jgi:DNA primase